MTLLLNSEPLPLLMDEEGTIRVGKTRVTLETVIGSFLVGYTPEEIVMQFSVLELADVYAVIAYYLRNQTEVNAYLQEVEREATQIREQLEVRFDQTRIRERLLIRQKNNY